MEPICCAVSIHHPLAGKARLTLEDLYGQNLLLMHQNWSHYVDELRDDLQKNHSQIHIQHFDFYNMESFNHCENSNDIFVMFKVKQEQKRNGWFTMKRIRTVMLPIAVMAFLTACGGKPDVTSGSALKQGINQ